MRAPLTAVALLACSLAAVVLVTSPKVFARAGQGAYDELSKLAASDSDSPGSLHSMAALLVATSSLRDFGPQRFPSGVADTITSTLVELQTKWISDKYARGVGEAHLASAMNELLDLSSAPEYMRFQRDQLMRMRVEAWWQAPAFMRSSPSRASLFGGVELNAQKMSPMEAFMVADMLFHRKLFEQDYLRTSEETALRPSYSRTPQQAGLIVIPPSARRDAFEKHVRDLVGKWNNNEQVSAAIRSVLEVSHDR